MKKVMIVDDEILIRENMRTCVDWEKEGFHYCGDAPDGEIALPLIEEWMPDILITDIKMPFMDGLELAAVVRKQMPAIKVVIMSGHDEFRYAQNAIRLGVEDYCLKPISAAELVELLHKVGRKIDEEQQRLKSQTVTKERLLADLCGGLIGTGEAIECAKELSIPLSARYYAVAIFDIRPAEVAEPQEPRVMNGLREAMDRQLVPGIDRLSFMRSRTELVVIFKGSSAERMAECLRQIGLELRAELEARFGCDIYTGAGSVQERLQGIHVSYLEAEEDKYIARLKQQNKAAFGEADESARVDVLVDRAAFLDFLKVGSPARLETFVRDFARELQPLHWTASSYGFYLLNDLTLEAFRAAQQTFRTGFDPSDGIGRLQQAIKQVATWEDCVQYLCGLLRELWRWRAEAADKYGDIIKSVKDYIVGQYNNDQLSLKVIAQHVRISPSHLSKVFSQETGQTLTEYLTQVRIGKAMELLKTTRRKSFEIAFDVGYNDPHYFSNLFKKITGMTTKEYRNQGASEVKEQARSEGRMA
ncbi:response regulator [Paenibacillus methanolicus]|uniref:Two-component system response regulator YesN n=1 Tax=Paenibacillus methanolicus TaxID=582686 RepID=A0A5S5C5C1_9BACL|nr:response regulator [Paenibacillus methanolicus]TYP74517.1 two-component system response regulator YesN [Paenibacillus methanolicus]